MRRLLTHDALEVGMRHVVTMIDRWSSMSSCGPNDVSAMTVSRWTASLPLIPMQSVCTPALYEARYVTWECSVTYGLLVTSVMPVVLRNVMKWMACCLSDSLLASTCVVAFVRRSSVSVVAPVCGDASRKVGPVVRRSAGGGGGGGGSALCGPCATTARNLYWAVVMRTVRYLGLASRMNTDLMVNGL